MIKRIFEVDEPPYHRPNDHWVEVPLTTVSEDGEWKTVTVRQRSLRSKRRMFTVSCTAFTIGMLMILLTSPFSSEFIVPGPLSSNHAQLLAGEGPNRCAACHAAANSSVAAWIAHSFSGSLAEDGLTQSELCMKCHEQSLPLDTSLNPHNVAPAELAQITKKYHSTSYDAGMIFGPPVNADHEIACSACHREHHGNQHGLSAMTDQQCQTCHQDSFHSFEIGHPEFTSYPTNRRARIAFDHSSHSLQHFPSKQTEFNCNQCHVDDSFRNVKKLASYDQACATCHHQQVLESGRDGLALISLPMVDVLAIEKSNLKIGGWPLAATGDFDGGLPPVMRVMLSADPVAAGILAKFGPEFDFSDIDPANPADVKDAVDLVWSIKKLLYELSLGGPRVIRDRLESVMKVNVTSAELQRLVTNLDEPVFQNAVRRWLPNLTAEIANHQFGTPRETERTGRVLKNIALKQSKMSWWPSDDDLLLRIVENDNDLLAANPLAGLIETQLEQPTIDGFPVVRIPIKQAKTELRQEPHPAPRANQPRSNVRLKNVHADPLHDPDLLAINPLEKLQGKHRLQDEQPSVPMRKEQTKIKIPVPPQPGLLDNPQSNSASKSPDSGKKLKPDVPVKLNKFVRIQPPSEVRPSGWFRNDQRFQITYQPSGHADSTIQSWIELVTRATAANTRPETRRLFEQTVSTTSLGMCRNCHTVDQQPDRSFAVNWKAEYREASIRSFTRFSHGPHLVQPELQDCSHCHTLDPNAISRKSYAGFDGSRVTSNFHPITKSNCTSCHAAQQANSGCTQCHSYHVGSQMTGVK